VNEYDKLQLVEADACKVDYASLLDGVASYQAIANLPYSISSIFIAKMLELNFPPQRMIFMLQKEMAMRLTAKTNTSEYGSLSVRTQFLYEVKILRLVPPQVFFPQPEIDSAIVQFKLRNTIPDLLHRKQAGELTRVVFAQKRKQIFKPLLMKYSEAKVLSALTQLEIARTARPAEISPEKYLTMSQLLQNG
jgi:16S rRNA (adenine1518-N6/adenine1519-N6)-dimethyltransferase